MRYLALALSALAFLSIPAESAPDHTRDYFFYRCVHEFYKGESLDRTDGSVGLEVEYLSIGEDETRYLLAKVAEVVRRLHAPPAGEVSRDNPRPTVLWTCLDESRRYVFPKRR